MTLPVSNKTKRLSLVALTGGVLALAFAIVDANQWTPPAAVTSAFTSLCLLLAGFYDWKHADGSVFYTGEDRVNGDDT